MLHLKSRIAKAVLNYFLIEDGKESYVNELARRLSLDTGNLTRKLIELETAGILRSRWLGQQRYYGLNGDFPLIKEYKSILLKTVGFEHQLKEALTPVKGIEKAVIFGSYAKDTMNAASDIDLLIIGNHSTIEVNRALTAVQKSLDREINVLGMTNAEYRSRKKSKDPLISSIEKNKKIVIV